MDFYKIFWKKTLDPEYLVAQTVSKADGTFGFENMEPGQYFILVVFPTIISGKKVTWQVPVLLEDNSEVYIRLNNENLSLPAYSRYSLPSI